MLIAVVQIVLGLGLLVGGAEFLVRGASGLAAKLGVSALVIGLTVVAFGTSSPEVAVSLRATFAGSPDIAVGNVVGSNIFNVLLILGLAAVITPLIVQTTIIRVDVPVMIAASLIVWALAFDGSLGRTDGFILLAGILIYTGAVTIAAIRKARGEKRAAITSVTPESPTHHVAAWKLVGLILLGLGGCVGGAELLVRGGVTVARGLGVSELIIGLTLIAAGTSLPELATSVVAAYQGERDIAVGNVVGSNIFNIFAILGLSGALSPMPIIVTDDVLSFSLPVMAGVAVACLPVFFTGGKIGRIEGSLFLAAYVAYLAYLIVDAKRVG